jgi:predicted ribosome quality control (RQC) complex YloA/Tae2 family protein
LETERFANQNIAVGYVAGQNLTTGHNNIYISNPSVDTESDTIRIGNVVGFTDIYGFEHGAHTATYIAGINGATASGGVAVHINSDGKLGTLTSSTRFKTDIKPMDESSTEILALKPVTFRYKHEIDTKGIPQFGLVAEDVEKVNPDLVIRDRDGKPYTVRYEALNAMLLNEFLKEHRKVEELEATVAQQRKDFQATIAKLQETISAQIKEQAAQIQ